MKRFIAAAIVASGLAAPALAGGGYGHGNAYVQPQQIQVVVSCYRGPFTQVIWDRPNTVFIDSLMTLGYSNERAFAIAERVCRDLNLVNDPAGLKSTTEALIASSPRG